MLLISGLETLSLFTSAEEQMSAFHVNISMIHRLSPLRGLGLQFNFLAHFLLPDKECILSNSTRLLMNIIA